MEPTLSDGDLVVADTGARQLVDGGVYLIRSHDRALVARVRQRLDEPGRLDLLYDNPRVPSATVAASGVEIVGRVVVMTRAM